MMDIQPLTSYYNNRAREYELVYHRKDPIRQGEQAALAEVTQHIVATDAAPETLAVAQEKDLPPERVTFREADAYRLDTGSVVFMAENVYVPGVGGELLTKPGIEDTFKRRTLSDGAQYEILKNYYTETDLHAIFLPRAANLQVHVGQCFWWITYEIGEQI